MRGLVVVIMIIFVLLVGMYLWVFGSDWYNIGSWRRWWRLVASKWLVGMGTAEKLRKCFKVAEIPQFAARKDHSHGYSAAARAAASRFWVAYARENHLEAYFVQMAKRDVAAGLRGSRVYFDPKDVDTPVEAWDPPPNPLFILIDTDYFMDMPVELATTLAGHPVALYTMVPSRAANGKGEVCWTFGVDGKLETTVSGGAKYSHHIWDYGDDVVTARTGARFVAYCVDRRSMTDSHQLVLLSPMGVYTFPVSLLAGSLIPGIALERFDPIVGEEDKFVRMFVQTQEGLFVSTAKCGSYLSSYTTTSVDESLRSVARNTGVNLTLGTVQSHVKVKPEPEEFVQVREESTVLLDYYLNGEVVVPKAFVYPVHAAVRRFEAVYEGSPADADSKSGMVAFMQPLVPEGFAPAITKNNERRAIEGRVLENRSGVQLTAEVEGYLNEFVPFVVPACKVGTVNPVELDEVAERQSHPRQRRALRAGLWLLNVFRRFWEMFLKKEAYQKVTDPRLIVQVDPGAKMVISQHMYALQPILHDCAWYAPGKTPSEIASRVGQICMRARFIADDDANRMDAHISPAARAVDLAVELAAFASCHHDTIRRYHAESVKVPVKSTFRLRYQSEFEWGSGDPRTSNAQTIRAAFIHYMAARRSGLNPLDSYEALGLYAGDDGFTADIPADQIVRAARLIGQDYEVKVVERGNLGVQFLGRYYGPDVWSGDDNSICDVARQLAKLHLSTPGNFTREEKIAEKAFAYMLTDRFTPIIGWWANAVVHAFPYLKGVEFTKENVSWWALTYKESDLWPNNVGTWAIDVVKAMLPGFDWVRFHTWHSSCTAEGLFNAPIFQVASIQDKPGMVEHGDPRGHVTGELVPNPLICEPWEKGKEELDTFAGEMKETTAKPVAHEFAWFCPRCKHSRKGYSTEEQKDQGLTWHLEKCDWKTASKRPHWKGKKKGGK